ncbi:hypothetical protein K458DRAFT_8209 [Lentithecium fluviatile CBS 122367]|uniref:Uncharacterized protein n=1 Tax=Lentithecium fluviatile CBS 122367 TaxID=1168545 RepID=A0A6G1JP80_9PLEO|nr:hypothetical protein K458DRAFT_8209 [Lentithecium fluviatile CBS 122367]
MQALQPRHRLGRQVATFIVAGVSLHEDDLVSGESKVEDAFNFSILMELVHIHNVQFTLSRFSPAIGVRMARMTRIERRRLEGSRAVLEA